MLLLKRSICLFVVLLMSSHSAQANTLLTERSNTVHEGFFLRFSPGFEYALMGDDSSHLLCTGELALGWSVMPNLALFLDARTSISLYPLTGFGEGDHRSQPKVMSFGLGASYYLTNNMYISASYGLGFYSPGTARKVQKMGLWRLHDEYKEVHDSHVFHSVNLA
jgi:hypothetical protein